MGLGATEIFSNIIGAIYVAIAWCKNFGLAVANMALGMWNVINAVVSNIMTAFKNEELNTKTFSKD